MLTVVVDHVAMKRLRSGSCWAFSNQVLHVEGKPAPGEVVRVLGQVRDARTEIGTAFYNPHSLIALRVLSLHGELPDRSLLATRLLAAEAFRRRLFPGADSWRTCHGESDGLPGLFVDRYADAFVVQALSAGMDRLLPTIAAILRDEMGARSVVERNESHLRELEGLPSRTGVIAGEAPGPVEASLPPLRLRVHVLEGQKTGLFLDQRENRIAARHARGVAAYEAHCNAGGFSIAAALAGARSVVAVDVSASAIEAARENARLNGVEDRIELVVADAEADMDARHRRRERFGLVMIDPPSFTRSRKHVPQARKALRDLNRRAMTLTEPGGILVSSDCSHHVFEDTFLEILVEAASQAERTLKLLEVRGASPDHTVLATMPETRYLKCVIAQVA
jgi:23S rRNA (cytosine1962-C5)-methyltransferase